jgi:pimeloyl-ACP methyl ester carboxylesterase
MYTSRCLHTGGGDEPPLVLLSGIGGHAETYIKNMHALADGLPNRDIYAIDFVGHGFSSAPTDIDYEISDYLDQVEDFIHAVGHDSAHVHGESLGAWVACKLAVERPEVVKSAGLNTIGGLGASVTDHVSEDIKETEQAEIEDLVDRTMEMLEDGFPREGVYHRMDWLFAEEPDEEIVDIRHAIYQREAVQEVMPQIYEVLLADPSSDFYVHVDDFEDLNVPTLIVHSAYNPGSKVETIEYARDLIDDVEYELFDHSAHWPQYEEPEKYNDVTIDYIQSLDV